MRKGCLCYALYVGALSAASFVTKHPAVRLTCSGEIPQRKSCQSVSYPGYKCKHQATGAPLSAVRNMVVASFIKRYCLDQHSP